MPATDWQQRNQQLLRGIRDRDPATIRALYADYYPLAERLVLSNSGTREDAADLFQDAMVSIFTKVKSGQLTLTVPFHNYLYAVCRKMWLRRLKKKRVSRVTFTDLGEYVNDAPAEAVLPEQTERYHFFQRKFLELGADCQKVLRMFFDGKKMEEIAQEMGYSSVGYAKKRKFKCKEQLVTRMKEDPVYGELKDE